MLENHRPKYIVGGKPLPSFGVLVDGRCSMIYVDYRRGYVKVAEVREPKYK